MFNTGYNGHDGSDYSTFSSWESDGSGHGLNIRAPITLNTGYRSRLTMGSNPTFNPGLIPAYGTGSRPVFHSGATSAFAPRMPLPSKPFPTIPLYKEDNVVINSVKAFEVHALVSVRALDCCYNTATCDKFSDIRFHNCVTNEFCCSTCFLKKTIAAINTKSIICLQPSSDKDVNEKGMRSFLKVTPSATGIHMWGGKPGDIERFSGHPLSTLVTMAGYEPSTAAPRSAASSLPVSETVLRSAADTLRSSAASPCFVLHSVPVTSSHVETRSVLVTSRSAVSDASRSVAPDALPRIATETSRSVVSDVSRGAVPRVVFGAASDNPLISFDTTTSPSSRKSCVRVSSDHRTSSSMPCAMVKDTKVYFGGSKMDVRDAPCEISYGRSSPDTTVTKYFDNNRFEENCSKIVDKYFGALMSKHGLVATEDTQYLVKTVGEVKNEVTSVKADVKTLETTLGNRINRMGSKISTLRRSMKYEISYLAESMNGMHDLLAGDKVVTRTIPKIRADSIMSDVTEGEEDKVSESGTSDDEEDDDAGEGDDKSVRRGEEC